MADLLDQARKAIEGRLAHLRGNARLLEQVAGAGSAGREVEAGIGHEREYTLKIKSAVPPVASVARGWRRGCSEFVRSSGAGSVAAWAHPALTGS